MQLLRYILYIYIKLLKLRIYLLCTFRLWFIRPSKCQLTTRKYTSFGRPTKRLAFTKLLKLCKFYFKSFFFVLCQMITICNSIHICFQFHNLLLVLSGAILSYIVVHLQLFLSDRPMQLSICRWTSASAFSMMR